MAAVMAVLLAAGCGGSGDSTSAVSQSSGNGAAYDTAAPEEGWTEEEVAESTELAADGGQITASTGIDGVESSEQKLIKTVSLTMETREFDTLLENIRGSAIIIRTATGMPG